MVIRLSHPLPGSTPTDSFGWRAAIPSIGLPAQLHNGQDYAAPAGTPILAAHAATVGWVGEDSLGGYGVRLDSPGYSTLYFHMRELSPLVRVGQSVSAGQPIGYVGRTGTATGNHLHLMLRINGVDVDPVPYIVTTPQPVRGGLPMFDVYMTGATPSGPFESGRLITGYGSFWIPSMQILDLLRRRHDAALLPGTSDPMLDAEHDIINGFLQTCYQSVQSGVQLDPDKLRDALTDALKAAGTEIVVDVNTEVPPEQLAAAFEVAAPRIAAAMVREAGKAMAGI